MANSLQFFDYPRANEKQAVDWGTGEPQYTTLNPSVIRAPTFLLKNQPINQVYRENRLELSNLRLNDQLVPKPFKINMLEKQIQQGFPMQHPFTSHQSQSALFPNYTAPEDFKRGDSMLRSSVKILEPHTPAQVEDNIVINKTHGTPWRRELKMLSLPTQRKGVWYVDEQYAHVPKPNDNKQQFYPYPPSVLAPNTKLRPEDRSIDVRVANVLRNKEKQIMQTTNKIDYYKDGLGTHAPLNSDDVYEKKTKYELTGSINDSMKPYFKRGTGLTLYSTAKNSENNKENQSQLTQEQIENLVNQPINSVLTKHELDETEMETGKDYRNYPESNYTKNPETTTIVINKAPGLSRSNTMPDMHKKLNDSSNYRNNQSKSAQNKLDAEKQKIDAEYHQRIQAIQTENRKSDLDLITPDRDIRLLRLKHNQLEKSRGSKPSLKQNIKPHISTFYQQEAKYFGERAQLYHTPVYNPYLVKQYIESVKAEPTLSTNFTSGSGTTTQANFQMPNDTYENRPKLFAHKVFSEYDLLKRSPLDQVLSEPGLSASLNTQENGQILQQTTYGGSYNTKKFLQEHEPALNKTSCELLYQQLEPGELDTQNITLKSSADHVALNNYKMGLTKSLDLNMARELVDTAERKAKESEKYHYPRMVGPIPPEPYETIYCTNEISEMSDGNSKRIYSRVYDSPTANSSALSQYEPLQSDLQAMSQYEAKAIKDFNLNQEHIKKLEQNIMRRTNGHEISFTDRTGEYTTRRENHPIVIQQLEQAQPMSNYTANFSLYTNESTQKCPPNDFYKPVEYKEQTTQLPGNIIELCDKWSKSLANQQYHSLYQNSCPDLRKNIYTGKKKIMECPQYVYKFANQ